MNLRAVEKGWRALWMSGVAGALPGPRTTSAPDWTSQPFSVLFLRYERIGDMVMATSLIREISKSYGTISLDVLGTRANAAVLDNNPYVRSVVAWSGLGPGAARSIRSAAYDVVVDGRINNPDIYISTPLLMLASRAPYRIGAGGGRRDGIYNIRVAPYDRRDLRTHFIEACARLAEPFGVNIDGVDWRPQLFLTPVEIGSGEAAWAPAARGQARGARLLVNLTAGDDRRRWPDERFVSVISAIRRERRDLEIVVIGSPTEWHRVEAVALASGAHAARTASLRGAFALVKAADMVFTPDTSIAHAASAFNRPCAVILMEVHAAYAPYKTPGPRITWSGDSMIALRVEPVLEALRSLVGEFAPR